MSGPQVEDGPSGGIIILVNCPRCGLREWTHVPAGLRGEFAATPELFDILCPSCSLDFPARLGDTPPPTPEDFL